MLQMTHRGRTGGADAASVRFDPSSTRRIYWFTNERHVFFSSGPNFAVKFRRCLACIIVQASLFTGNRAEMLGNWNAFVVSCQLSAIMAVIVCNTQHINSTVLHYSFDNNMTFYSLL